MAGGIKAGPHRDRTTERQESARECRHGQSGASDVSLLWMDRGCQTCTLRAPAASAQVQKPLPPVSNSNNAGALAPDGDEAKSAAEGR